MSEKATEVTQREMIRIIGLFRKQGFKGNYLSFQHVVDEGATYFVVMGDGTTVIKACSKLTY